MLGDNEHGRNGPGEHRVAVPQPGRQDVLVHDRPRGYPSADWWDEPHIEHRELDLVKYWRMLLKHWLLIAAVLILAIAIGVGVTLLTKPIYTATATIQIDREAARVVNDIQTLDNREASGQADEFFQTQHAIIKSRVISQDAVRESGLARDPVVLKALGFEAPKGATAGGSQLEEAVIGTIQQKLVVSPVQRSRIVAVSIDTYDANASARIVNAISESFIQSPLKRRMERSAGARAFLQGQMETAKEKLEESERQLAAYARARQMISIPSGDDKGGSTSLAGSSLAATNSALNTARAARYRAEARWNTVSQADGGVPVEVLQSPLIQMLKQQQTKLDTDYLALSGTYTPGGRIANQSGLEENRQSRADLDKQIERETQNIKNAIRDQYQVALAEERNLERTVNGLRNSVMDLRDRNVDYDIISRERDTNRSTYETLLRSYQDIGVAGDIKANNVSILDRALPPGFPSKPEPIRNLITAGLLGLMVGIGLAFVLELLDESIRTPEDVEKKLGLTLLGTIPRLDRGVAPREALADLRSPFAEAYYSVRTALQFSTNEGAPRSLLVTSARPSEGKSTSATAIAQNFARLGMRVLLIDADLRNPSLHRSFGVENSAGLSNYLTGGKSLEDLVRGTDTPNLYFLPCGPLPPNPAELLAGPRLQSLLADGDRNFDIVVIDGPPVMGLADAPLLASWAIGTLLVVEAGGTGRNLAKIAVRRLGVGNSRLLGVLLTKFDARKSSYGYGYGYGYAYDYDYGARPALKDQS